MDAADRNPATVEKVSKTERLLNLISFMLRSRTPVPFAKIAGHVVGYDDDARLDSIEKRFDRDKAELRNMGIPVEYVDGGTPEASGYVIPKDRFFLGEIELDSVDAVILALAGRAGAIAYSSPVMKDAFLSAMRKLAVDAPDLEEVPAERASLLQVGSGHMKAGEFLPTICSAVYARRRIGFAYSGARDEEPRKRKVDPYGLGIDRGEWYLVGRDHDRDDVRVFRLSRVTGSVQLIGASDATNEFAIPKGFRVEDHLFRDPWDYGEGEPAKVRVSVPSELAGQFRLRSRRSYAVESEADGRAVVVFDVRAPERMADWLLSLGPGVAVLSPESMKQAMARRIDAHAAHYAKREKGA